MNDPTYDQKAISMKPEWALAFSMSELENDNAPIGWGKYISLATGLLNNWNITRKAG